LTAVAALVTWFLPAGTYERVEVEGRSLVDPESYQRVEPRPAGPAEILLAFPRGLAATAPIVFYIFLIGGTFGVLQATGAIERGVDAVVAACRGRGEIAIPTLMVLFSLGGGTIGMAEETLPFLPALVLLARRLGYDELTGGAIALVGAGAGFAGAFLNPFTVGVAQGIAGLPLFSGLGYRLIVWTVTTTIAVFYVSRWARRHRVRIPAGQEPSTPSSAPAQASEHGATAPRAGSRSVSSEAASTAPAVAPPKPAPWRTTAVLSILALALLAVVVGAMRWGWGLTELAALFVAVAVAAGLVGGLGASGTADAFVAGAAGLTGGALVVGLARGVLVIFDGARVTDTILHAMAGAVEGLPAAASLAGIYGVQVALSYLVPSGSGQAALSLPILVPLADLAGISRQVSVLAYQFGDGFSNIFTPTQGYFMAGLALIGVPWTRWARFLWPLQVAWLAAGMVLLLVAHSIGWGPF
jgi:uncharacterized ion transporter superfamily protein YfcC